MTQLQFLREWSVYAVGVAFWVCFLWPAAMRVIWPWNRSEWGWNMVIKTEMIALALFPSVLRTEFGVQAGLFLEWVVVAAVTAIPLVITWRSWIIYRAQRDGADDDGPP
jgi:hypothetical protein